MTTCGSSSKLNACCFPRGTFRREDWQSAEAGMSWQQMGDRGRERETVPQ